MTTSDDLRVTAQRVRRFDDGLAVRMTSLATALESDDLIDEWLSVDPLAYLAPNRLGSVVRAAQSRSIHVARLERLRNLLVLVPVFLTWLGLAYAAIGYAAVASADPDSLSMPFLLLWEQSFNGLVGFPASIFSFLTLSNVAIIDMITIAIVLVLTWLIHSEVSVRQAQRDDTASELEAEVTQLAWCAALQLSRRQSDLTDSAAVTRLGEGLVDSLRAERERMEKLREEREQEVAALSQYSKDFATGVKGLKEFVSALRGATSTAEIVAAAVDERLVRGVAALELAAAAMQSLQQPLADSAATTQSSTSEVRDAVRLLTDATDRALPMGGTLATTIAALSADLLALRHDIVDARQSDDEGRRALAVEVETLHAAMARLESPLAKVGVAIASLDAALATASRQQEDARVRSDQQLAIDRELGEAAAGMAAASSELQALTGGLRQGLQELAATIERLSGARWSPTDDQGSPKGSGRRRLFGR